MKAMVRARAFSLAVLLSLPLSGFACAQTAPILAVVGGIFVIIALSLAASGAAVHFSRQES